MFDPFSAAILAGGSIIAGSMANKGAKARNREAQEASAKQMAFQEDMSNTSYERAMQDMRNAGLNPILAGKVGGASTPTGSTYNPENVATGTVNAITQTAQAYANIANTKAMTDKTRVETDLLKQTKGSGLGKTGEYVKDLLESGTNSVRNFIDNMTFYEGEATYSALKEKGFIPQIPSDYKKRGGIYMINPRNKRDRIFVPFDN